MNLVTRSAWMLLSILVILSSLGTAAGIDNENNLVKWQSEMQSILTCHAAAQESSIQLTEDSFFDCFRSFQQIDHFLSQLVQNYPTSLSKVLVARTTQGRSMWGYQMTNGNAKKPILYIQAGIHPREWVSISSTVYAIASLLQSNSTQVLGHFNLVIVPIVNIDGYLMTWSNPSLRLLRKNVNGVDLNRNFGPVELFQATSDRTSETYPGTHAMSESETAGISTYLTLLKNQLKGTLDVHTTAGVVLRPLSVKKELLSTADEVIMKRIGDSVAQAMNVVGVFTGYSSIPGHELYQNKLYAGTFKDMVYLSLNRTPSLTIELYGTDGFVAPNNSIRSSGRELVAAIEAFAVSLID